MAAHTDSKIRTEHRGKWKTGYLKNPFALSRFLEEDLKSLWRVRHIIRIERVNDL